MVEEIKKPPPVFNDAFVVLHDCVGAWPTRWYRTRVVLPYEYTVVGGDHTEWDLRQEHLQRLGEIGAARAASTDETAAAQAAKNAATAAGTPWYGYYVTDEAEPNPLIPKTV